MKQTICLTGIAILATILLASCGSTENKEAITSDSVSGTPVTDSNFVEAETDKYFTDLEKNTPIRPTT